MKRIAITSLPLWLFASAHAFAQSSGAPQLPRPGGVFDVPSGMMQNAVNFAVGPFATLVTVLLLAAMGFLWAFAPNQGMVGLMMRFGSAGFLLMTIGQVVLAFRVA